jgi:hypothetical protein
MDAITDATGVAKSHAKNAIPFVKDAMQAAIPAMDATPAIRAMLGK